MSYANALSTCASICFTESVCVCVCVLPVPFCLLVILSPFHFWQDETFSPVLVCVTSTILGPQSPTGQRQVRCLSQCVWVLCESVNSVVLARSIFKRTELLFGKLHGETRDQALW